MDEDEWSDLASENALALRIADERKRRGLSQEDLARRVEAVLGGGFPQSAISKIEKGRGRRAITVDEALAFSRVLDLPLSELLMPPRLVALHHLRESLMAISHFVSQRATEERDIASIIDSTVELIEEHPEVLDELRALHEAGAGSDRSTSRPDLFRAPALELMFGSRDLQPSEELSRAVEGLRAAVTEKANK